MAINFSEKFHQRLMKGFEQHTETDSMFDHSLDMEFSGVYTVHVTSVVTEPLQDYDKSKSLDKGSRYGAFKEVGDEVQTFDMTGDKSLNLTIDKGNNEGQFNMKKAGEVMAAETKEQIGPYLDKYRLRRWAEQGNHVVLAAAPAKNNIIEAIMAQKDEMLDKYVPDQLQLTIARKYLRMITLSEEWVKLENLGGKTLPKGTIGEFYGMAVKPMPASKMPDNVPWMITHKGALIAPTKIKKFKGHVDPPGLNGDLIEFRMIQDAFVLGKKADGVSVAVLPGFTQANPTIALSGADATITATGAEATYYTVDGSDPRFSKTAKVYTAKVTLEAGQTIRAYSVASGKYASGLAEATYAG
jgi:hypothetical protein